MYETSRTAQMVILTQDIQSTGAWGFTHMILSSLNSVNICGQKTIWDRASKKKIVEKVKIIDCDGELQSVDLPVQVGILENDSLDR